MAEFVQTTLMDSYAGGPHITEAQLGLAHQATFGPDDYVLEGGRESEAQVLTNNSIRIFDAVYCIQGRRDVIPASGYTDVTIANGTQGMNRNDIIVRRYKKNESSEIESTEYAVIKGTPNAGAAVDPEVTTGDIRSGATLHEMALYRVKITGLNITAVEPMFNILKNMASLQKEFAELNSKMMAGDYAVIDLSGWIFSYKQLGNNLLWFNIAQNINNQSASNRRDQGVKIPFTLPFDQHSFGHINVAGYPVGEDIFSFYKDGSVWMGSTGYDGYATYHASGILVIN